jgi:alkylation response protein AidB-like acyl-CoA dehydrogenase
MAVLSDEQIMLKEAAAAWVRERSPVTALRKLRDSGAGRGHDPVLYAEMAAMGWTGIVIPEPFGGAGFDYTGLGLILEQLGRTLTASPLISSSLSAASALLLGGSAAQQQTWLPAIADGSLIATLAIDEGPHHDPHDPLKTQLAATANGNGWTLRGKKQAVLEGMAAGLAIVATRTAGQPGDRQGLTLFLVDTATPGLTRAPLHPIDSRDVAIYNFDDVAVAREQMLGAVGEGAPLLDQVLDRTCAGLAAEMLGSADEALHVTLEYLKIREQFGHIIGSFQALQHRAAAMLGELELTRTAVAAALQAIDHNSEDIPRLASLAKAMACETLKLISNEMIQLHGGIGMTDEHDAGLYLKRARAAAASYGNAAFHRERYARLSGF